MKGWALALLIVGVSCTPAQYPGEVHCPGNSTWDGARCVGSVEGSEGGVGGDYVGEISVGGRSTRVDTHLRSSGGVITGDYTYAGNSGQFSNCQLSGPALSCTWTEPGLTGSYRVQLSGDGSSFSGSWDFSDGRPGGSWTGQRQGGAPAATPSPTTSGSGVDGTYHGNIGVNGRLGPVDTRLTTSGGVVSGDYSYGNTSGRFSNCQLAGTQLSCLWTEPGMTGNFRVTFASDMNSFSGSWDYSNGQPGGSWNGSR